MPTVYHNECGKPVSVKRTNLHLPRRVKSFHSKSAPNSPLQIRNLPATEPRYTKAVHLLFEAKRIAKELEEKKVNGELIKYRARGTSCLKSKENDRWDNTTTRRCEACSNTLKTGMFSTHQGVAFCNVPCYSMLFSPLATRSNTPQLQNSKTTLLTQEQETKRNILIPKLRTYNTYYSEKACQICCFEDKKELFLEGQLKVYWGLKSPVTLSENDVSYWRNFKPEPPCSWSNNKSLIKLDENCNKVVQPMARSVRRAKSQYANKQQRPESAVLVSTSDSNPAKLKRTQSTALKRNGKHLDNMQFTPPHASATTIRITDRVKVYDVVTMLLKKFQIRNKPDQYTLFTVFESGSVKQLQPDDSPLAVRLRLGPCEDVAKMFIMEKDGQSEVSHEVAQYAQFSMTVLEKFHEKFIEEEEREIDRIKAKYESFKSMLRLQLEEIHNNLKETEV